MVESLGDQRAVVRADWPQPAVVSEPQVLADDSILSLMYRTADDRYAVVRFPLCIYFAFGAPNDEALGGHPQIEQATLFLLHGSKGPGELQNRAAALLLHRVIC